MKTRKGRRNTGVLGSDFWMAPTETRAAESAIRNAKRDGMERTLHNAEIYFEGHGDTRMVVTGMAFLQRKCGPSQTSFSNSIFYP